MARMFEWTRAWVTTGMSTESEYVGREAVTLSLRTNWRQVRQDKKGEGGAPESPL